VHYRRLFQSRAMVHSDWERFLSNAKHIRMFNFDAGAETSDPNWVAVASQCPGGIIFPNLRFLVYSARDEEDWPWLKVLAAPTLQILLLFASLNSDGIAIVSTLPQRCPAIRDLVLECRSTPAPLRSDLICHWKNLYRIHLNSCDSRTLTHLSLIRKLSELTISSFSPPTHGRFTFPALRDLRLGPCSFNHSVEFMHCISASRLSTLRIHVEAATNIRWLLLFQVIRERLSDAPLSHFVFSFYEALGVDCPDPTAGDIRPLYIFPNVTTFTFNSRTSFKLDDHWIQEIAVAWPNLTTLELGESFSLKAEFSHVTVAGLAFLARKCQNLSTFHMQIDGRIVGPPLEDQSCGLRSNERVRSISLGYSPIEDVTGVAMVLASALPNLCHIEVEDGRHLVFTVVVGGSHPSVHATRWKEVEGLVRTIREQEDGLASRSEQG
jgi:hypothetical protein